MNCDHAVDHAAQLAYSAPTGHRDDDERRRAVFEEWCSGVQLEGLEPTPVEVACHRHDRDQALHCGTVELGGRYWDIYLATAGAVDTTRTRWETVTDPATGETRYLPVGPETLTLLAPYVRAHEHRTEPLGEDIRLAVAAAAEPRLMTAEEGWLVERCVRAALAADREAQSGT